MRMDLLFLFCSCTVFLSFCHYVLHIFMHTSRSDIWFSVAVLKFWHHRLFTMSFRWTNFSEACHEWVLFDRSSIVYSQSICFYPKEGGLACFVRINRNTSSTPDYFALFKRDWNPCHKMMSSLFWVDLSISIYCISVYVLKLCFEKSRR